MTDKELQQAIEHTIDDYYDADMETLKSDLAARDIMQLFKTYQTQDREQELAHLLEEVEGVIGEDEIEVNALTGLNHIFVQRNIFRAEQRKALTQLRKKYLGD